MESSFGHRNVSKRITFDFQKGSLKGLSSLFDSFLMTGSLSLWDADVMAGV